MPLESTLQTRHSKHLANTRTGNGNEAQHQRWTGLEHRACRSPMEEKNCAGLMGAQDQKAQLRPLEFLSTSFIALHQLVQWGINRVSIRNQTAHLGSWSDGGGTMNGVSVDTWWLKRRQHCNEWWCECRHWFLGDVLIFVLLQWLYLPLTFLYCCCHTRIAKVIQ